MPNGMTIDANTGLLSDAASKTVSPVTLSAASLRRTPNPSTVTVSPRTVAIAIPGTLASRSRVPKSVSSGLAEGIVLGLDDIASGRVHAAASMEALVASQLRRFMVMRI
jgi:hypothetical protein